MNKNTPPLSVIFDLDGTLVESAPDLAATANELLRRRGRDEVSLDQIRHMVGKGARALMSEAMKATGEEATTQELDEMLREFLQYYGAHIADSSHTFPGAIETLEQLKSEGCLLAVCTNKFEGLSRKLLEALSVLHYFDDVVGSDTLFVRKPNPGHILGTLERIGGTPENAVMIGDSANDIDAAKAANVKSVAVTFGYTDKPAGELGADAVISKFPDLIPQLEILTGRMLY
ncbi:MAG: phosphoglycolate phosphatase [Hyphomicrobiales bacterium]